MKLNFPSDLESAYRALRKIRHDISSSISMLDSSMKNISGPNPDPERAIRMHGVGLGKLRVALDEFDTWVDQVFVTPEREKEE